MKIVVDTNVLVSAILKDRDPERVVLFIAAQPDFEWIVSPEIMREYKEVLDRPKFKLPQELRDRWFALLERLTTVIDLIPSLRFPRDQKDAKFLACAQAVDADLFITGDHDFSEAQPLVDTRILSVAQFVKAFCGPT